MSLLYRFLDAALTILYGTAVAVVLALIVFSWFVLLSGALHAAEPALHLYTPDGKPRSGWDVPDFQVTWHRSVDLSPQWQAYGLPLVAHYRTKDGWRYSRQVTTPRELRKAYRKDHSLVGTPGSRTLVWVHAEGCGPCEKMRPFMPEVARLLTVEQVGWDWETPGEFRIKSVPLTILMDADNREVRRWSGFVDFQTLKASVSE